MNRPLRVLLVAQTPPPFGGQAVMMQSVLEGQYEGVEIRHVRMAFSRDINEIGKFRFRKIIHLIAVIGRVVAARLRFHSTVLYYPPAGPDVTPLVRDLILLVTTRWMFKRVVFHFQAGGLSDLYGQLAWPLRWLFRLAYFDPFVGIRVSKFAPEDPQRLLAEHAFIVPNAVSDVELSFRHVTSEQSPQRIVLFVGVLRESKGVGVLLESARLLLERGLVLSVRFLGQFESERYENEVRSFVQHVGLEPHVEFAGVLTGDAKLHAFQNADLFCLPTYFESEGLPVVVIEAMRAALPVVSTRWRGVPDVVEDGVNGLLTPIKDPPATSAAIEQLLSDHWLAARMGAAGRQRYEADYTLPTFHRRIEGVLQVVRRDLGMASHIAGARGAI